MRLSRLLKANEFSIYLQNSERKSYTNPTGNMHIQCKQGGNQNCALRHNITKTSYFRAVGAQDHK